MDPDCIPWIKTTQIQYFTKHLSPNRVIICEEPREDEQYFKYIHKVFRFNQYYTLENAKYVNDKMLRF